MRGRKWSRRELLKASTASAAGLLFAEPLNAASPPATAVTPALIEAAKKEGKLSFYSALELSTAERLARTFEAKYPGISVRVERSGAERIFQRIAQEQGSGINAVDVANSTDPAHYLDWKKNGWLAPYVPEDVAKAFSRRSNRSRRHVCDVLRLAGGHRLQHQPRQARGCAEELCRSARSQMARQDRQGPSRLQRRHHDRDLRADARSRLAISGKARATEGHAGAVGRRSAEEDTARRARRHGRRQRLQSGAAQGSGQAGRSGLPTEGSPLIIVPCGIFQGAPNPNAAKLFQSFFFSAETQQMLVDVFAHRSFHAQVKEKGEHIPLASLKLLKSDPARCKRRAKRSRRGTASCSAFSRRPRFTKQKALRRERLSHFRNLMSAARTPPKITANSTCRIRPGAASFRSARLRSSSARCSCR